MMILLYRTVIQSVLSFCIVPWFGNLNLTNENRLSRLVRAVSKAQPSGLYDQHITMKTYTILDCTDHPLQRESELLPSEVDETSSWFVDEPVAIPVANRG